MGKAYRQKLNEELERILKSETKGFVKNIDRLFKNISAIDRTTVTDQRIEELKLKILEIGIKNGYDLSDFDYKQLDDMAGFILSRNFKDIEEEFILVLGRIVNSFEGILASKPTTRKTTKKGKVTNKPVTLSVVKGILRTEIKEGLGLFLKRLRDQY